MAVDSSVPWIEAGREAGLLLCAQQGDVDSFDELMRAHAQPFYRLCFALACRPDDAAEIMIESAQHAWRGLHQLPVGRPFFPCLARIARARAAAHRRRMTPEAREASAHRPSGLPWGGGASDPAHMAEEQRIYRIFRDLGADDQMLLSLRLVEGLGYPQIAQVMDLTEGAVAGRLQALRARFESAAPAEAA